MLDILIMSCDKYDDCWQPFSTLYNKYFSNNYKTYIVTETKDCEYFDTIKKTGAWTKRLREALQDLDSDYVLLMLDDYFIRNKVDNERIEYALNNFEDNTAWFNFEKAYDLNDTPSQYKGFKKRNNGICKTSCQAGIWNREKLIELLNVNCSPWEWERLNISLDYDYYINSEDYIIDYGFKVGDFSIVGGKWSEEIVPFFEKENIKIDYNKRGFMDLQNIKKKFSIIIPNYNNDSWIEKTIKSVQEQTYRNWEVYIIDDVSTDDSIKIIKKNIDGFKNIELIQNDIKLYNGGSRNAGILKAKKSNKDGYLLFIDSDDWLSDNKVLEELNNFICNNDSPDLITLSYQYFMNNKISNGFNHTWKTKLDLFKANGNSMCAVWCKCFKTEIAPLFEYNTLMEDRNYHYRVTNRAKTFVNFNRVTHTWNKMNIKSITTDKNQNYLSNDQPIMDWDSCAYRHIAGMYCVLKELQDQEMINYIKSRISDCESKIRQKTYQQY